MPLREIVEVGAFVALHGSTLIRGEVHLPERSLIGYWSASKSRLDHWGRSLKILTNATTASERASSESDNQEWLRARPVLEEILVSELLTRVWTAVVSLRDRQSKESVAEPVMHSVFAGHLESRHRALQLMATGRGIGVDQAIRLNRLRRRVESWTDVLLGYLARHFPASEFAFEPARAKEFAAERRGCSPHREELEWNLTLAALRGAFAQHATEPEPNALLNSRIAANILLAFQPECFDAFGLFKNLWLQNLSHQAADSHGLIAELLSLDDAAHAAN